MVCLAKFVREKCRDSEAAFCRAVLVHPVKMMYSDVFANTTEHRIGGCLPSGEHRLATMSPMVGFNPLFFPNKCQ